MEMQRAISRSVWIKYLNLYLGEDDWNSHIDRLYRELLKKADSKEDAAQQMRKVMSCAILLPQYDKSLRKQQSPSNLLFKCRFFHQFDERDWSKEFERLLDNDAEIEPVRNRALALGIVDPIDYAPVTRQAFNWLFDAALNSGSIDESNQDKIKVLCKRLVWAYGGTVVCAVFRKSQKKIDNIWNWHTNYFFEKLIYEVFTPTQILQIKHQELQKVNKKLVKRLER